MADAYSAFRQLERLFGYKGPDFKPNTDNNEEFSGELYARIHYDPEARTIFVEHLKENMPHQKMKKY
jgi:hypothetical protein